MFYKKLATIAFAMTMIFSTACSSDADRTQTEDVAMANLNAEAPAEKKVSVYEMKEVMESSQALPEFTWEQDGKTIKFSDYVKGKTVFLNFWGTWCPPCRAEIPHIIQLQKELKDKDFVVVGFALEHKPGVANVQKFVDAKGINYINFVSPGSEAKTGKLIKHFGGMRAVPTTYIFNKKGEQVEKIVGGRDYKAFKSSVDKAL